MKTELTMAESLKREKGVILPQDFSEGTLLTASHHRNCMKALRKQVPMQVTDIIMHYFICPECGYEDTTIDVEQVPKYCRNCGQALFQD